MWQHVGDGRKLGNLAPNAARGLPRVSLLFSASFEDGNKPFDSSSGDSTRFERQHGFTYRRVGTIRNQPCTAAARTRAGWTIGESDVSGADRNPAREYFATLFTNGRNLRHVHHYQAPTSPVKVSPYLKPAWTRDKAAGRGIRVATAVAR